MQLDQERITSQLAHCALGHTLFYYASVPSTMPIAQELASDPAIRSGTVVVAEEQTAGRGRQERRWATSWLPRSMRAVLSSKRPFPWRHPTFLCWPGWPCSRGLARLYRPWRPTLASSGPMIFCSVQIWLMPGKPAVF